MGSLITAVLMIPKSWSNENSNLEIPIVLLLVILVHFNWTHLQPNLLSHWTKLCAFPIHHEKKWNYKFLIFLNVKHDYLCFCLKHIFKELWDCFNYLFCVLFLVNAFISMSTIKTITHTPIHTYTIIFWLFFHISLLICGLYRKTSMLIFNRVSTFSVPKCIKIST